MAVEELAAATFRHRQIGVPGGLISIRASSAKQWAEAQLEKEIRELMRRAEILDAQEDGIYSKGKLGSDLPVAQSASAKR